MAIDRADRVHKLCLEANGRNVSNQVSELKELKLPRVQQNRSNNRYKERIYKQNSLRSHKIY
jgi:hypothetical protein